MSFIGPARRPDRAEPADGEASSGQPVRHADLRSDQQIGEHRRGAKRLRHHRTREFASGDTSHTAMYDISAYTVYLPNGERLEAHSGIGECTDDVRSVHLRSLGPTPPKVYEFKLRESPFHEVQAIRLNPVDGGKMYGHDGILAHPFMLGPNGQSNGCMS